MQQRAQDCVPGWFWKLQQPAWVGEIPLEVFHQEGIVPQYIPCPPGGRSLDDELRTIASMPHHSTHLQHGHSDSAANDQADKQDAETNF